MQQRLALSNYVAREEKVTRSIESGYFSHSIRCLRTKLINMPWHYLLSLSLDIGIQDADEVVVVRRY